MTIGFSRADLSDVNRGLGGESNEELLSLRTGVDVSVAADCSGVYLRGGLALSHHLILKKGRSRSEGWGPCSFDVALTAKQLPAISTLPEFGKGWVDAIVLEGQIFIPLVPEEDRKPVRKMKRRTKEQRAADEAEEVAAKIAAKLGKRGEFTDRTLEVMAPQSLPLSTDRVANFNLIIEAPDGGEITACYSHMRVVQLMHWMDGQGQGYTCHAPRTKIDNAAQISQPAQAAE